MSEPAASPSPQKGSGLLTGVAWMLGFRLFDRVAGILSILVLARLLLPEHFGVVALASAVVAFIELLSALGLDTILIQQRELSRDHYDTAWTIQMSLAALCAVLLSIAAWPASIFFHEPRLQGIVYALALCLLLDGAVNIRVVDFRRQMRFDKEFLFMAVRRVVQVLMTMGSAFILRNEWALAIGIVSSRTTGVVMSYLMAPYRPRFTYVLRKELLSKSTWLFLSNVVFFARQRASDFTLGRLSGASSVGTYALAADLANLVSQELVSPINRVALPDLSARSTEEAIRRRFDLITGQLAIVLAPLCLGLSACASLLVPLLFGAAWAASADVLRVLAVAGMVAGLASNIGVGFLSLGHYRANAWIHAVGAGTLLPLLIFGTLSDGAHGAALAVLAANTVTTFVSLLFARRAMSYGPIDFLKRVWRPLLAASLMYLAIGWVAGELLASGNPLPAVARQAIQIAVGATSYLVLLLILALLFRDPDGAERLTLKLIRNLLQRRRRPAA